MNNIKENQKQMAHNNNIWLIYIAIFSIILTPNIRLGSLPSFRIEQIIVILFSLYFIIELFLRKKTEKTNLRFPIMYLGFSLIIIISILVGSLKGITIVINDFFEIYKVFIYLGLYIITAYLVKSEEDKIKILKFMIFCMLISVLISVQQYFNLFNLNETYIHIIAPSQSRPLLNNHPNPRVVGMTSNPNTYAIIPGIGTILSLAVYSYTKEKKYISFFLIYVLGVLMTKSRSGFVFMLIGTLFFVFLYIIKSNFKITRTSDGRINIKGLRTIITTLILLILFAIIIYIVLPDELNSRLVSGLNLKTDNSFQARLINWKEHIDLFKLSPIFGLGPGKSIEYGSYTDNEWILFLRRYGIIGTIYIALTFLRPFIKSKDKFFKYIYFSVLLASGLYMIPAAIYHVFQIMPLIMILAALISKDENKTTGIESREKHGT